MRGDELKAIKQGSVELGEYWVYDADDVDALLAKKDAEIESLKASHYAEMVDAGMRERRLRRALWLAREWRAWCEVEFWSVAEGDKPKDVFHLSCTKRVHRMPITWVAYWQEVARKCKAKAEEYK